MSEESAESKSRWDRLTEAYETTKRIVLNVTVVVAFVVFVPVFVKMVTTRGVVISDITVPSSLSDRSFSGDVVARRILDRLNEITAYAASQKKQTSITGAAAAPMVPDIQLPLGGINLTGAISQIRSFLGYTDTKISGEIVTETPGDKPTYSLRLRIAGRGVVYHSATPSANVDQLIEEAAMEVMHHFDPINLAYYTYRNKDYKNAYRMTETALANDAKGDDGWAFNMRGLIHADQGHVEEAIAAFREAIRREPSFAVAYHNLSQTMRVHGKLDEAEKIAMEAIKLAPKDREGYANLALAKVEQGKSAEALALMQKAVAEDPRNPQSHLDLGTVFHSLGRMDDAAAAFQKAIEIKPELPDSYQKLSATLHRMGKYEEAYAEAQKAADVDPKSAVPWNLLGLYSMNRNDYPKAAANFEKATSIDKRFAEGWVNLGAAHMAQKKYDNAGQAFARASELQPHNAEILAGWARALELQGQPQAAQEKLRTAIAISPKQAMLYETLGRLQEGQGDVTAAVDNYRQAATIDPKAAETLKAQIERLTVTKTSQQ